MGASLDAHAYAVRQIFADFPDTRTLHFLLHEIVVEGAYSHFELSDADLIIDCGAHIGLSALNFALRAPAAQMHCFEPDPESAEWLRLFIGRAGLAHRVHVHQEAVARRSGPVRFYSRSRWKRSLHSSLDGDRDDLPASPVTVPGIALSAFIGAQTVDLLKLDVEGSEVDVLLDLIESSSIEKVRHLIVEVHHDHRYPERILRVIKLLVDVGFRFQLSAKAPGNNGLYQDILILADLPHHD